VLDGGLGADTMAGGAGDDTYIVDNSSDVVTEAAGDGVDTVRASANYALGANVENLILTGTANIMGVGNEGDNILTGNSGANTLDGGLGADFLYGGAGNDTLIGGEGDDTLDGGLDADLMQGGAGNDSYVVDNRGDTIVEAAGGGIDTVNASVSYTLSADVENLVLTGSGNLDGTGNASANIITGTSGDNLLAGMEGNDTLIGGTGNDVLLGGAGDDNYLIRAGDGNDRIVDAQGSDTLYIGSGLTLADLHAEQDATDLVLTAPAAGNRIVLAGWLGQSEGVSRIVFDDGTALDRAGIRALLNSAPTAVADTLVVHEDGGPVAIPVTQLLANDTDPDAGDIVRVISVGQSAAGATVSLNGDAVTYDIGASYQELAEGEVVNDSFTYTVTDAMGETSTSVVEVQIVGVNDAALVVADTAAVTEGSAATATGNVLANDSDVDKGTVLKVAAPGTYAGAYGSLAIAQDGSYTYALNDNAANVQALGAGQVVSDNFSYVATDGLLGVASTLAITVTGTNDAPIVVADTAQVTEDSAVAASGNVLANDHDVDSASLAVVAPGTYAGTYGSLTLAQDGSYTYTLNDNAANVQSLAEGQAVVDSFTYSATDGVAQVASRLDITIDGANDAPVVSANAAQVKEDLVDAVTGNVLANASDVDAGTVLTVADAGTMAGQYGTLALQQDGSYVYSLNAGAANVQALAQGETVVEHFAYVTTDGIANAASSLDITVAGTNDAPIVAADAAKVAEDSLVAASGNVLANDHDVDNGALLKVAAPGTYTGAHGTLSLDQDGSYTYSLDNAGANVQSLAEGQSVVDSFTYSATDGIDAVASRLDITISGANDAPVVTADTAQVTEHLATSVTGNVLANDHDVDAGSVLTVASSGTTAGRYGSLALQQDGSYVYNLNNDAANVQALGRGESVVEHFEYVATDGSAKVSSTLDVTVRGSNDAPTVAIPLADQDLTFNKAFSFNLPANAFTDSDKGDTLTYAATLANGSALPSWLKFNATTGSFTGTTPKEVGSIDVKVTATDKVAADGSTAGSLSVSDVFTLAVSHGNEGVGNGSDAPPAGHDQNYNDGPGTSPGNPGSKGGIGLPLPKPAAAGANTVLTLSAQIDTPYADTTIKLAIPAYLTPGQLSNFSEPSGSMGNTVSASQTFGNWLAVDLAVSAAVADQKTLASLNDHGGIDVTVVSKATAGYLGSTAAIATSALSLTAGSGTDLKGFDGLGKGVKKIK
jgi:VCBS repeat-containing protein